MTGTGIFRLFTIVSFVSLCLMGGSVKLHDGRSYEGEIIQKGGIITVVSQESVFQFNKKEIKEMNGQPIAQEKNPVIRIATSKGDMLFELFEDEVPNTVANMISLAESGFYKGMSFHRIIDGFMAQGGCPNSKRGATGMVGTGGPGYRFADEFSSKLIHNQRGILSMANSGPNSNGSQFFICFGPTPHLNNRHAVFGKIISGMEILDELEKIGTQSGRPTENVQFNIEVVTKRNHDYKVRKI